MNSDSKRSAEDRGQTGCPWTDRVDLETVPDVRGFHDEATGTISYIVRDPSSNSCAIIDSVMDLDYAAGRIRFEHADQLIDSIREQGLELEWIIE